MRHPYVRRSVDIDMCAVDDCPAPEDKDDPEVHYTQEDMEYVASLYKEYTASNLNKIAEEDEKEYTSWANKQEGVIGPDKADFIRDEERNK